MADVDRLQQWLDVQLHNLKELGLVEEKSGWPDITYYKIVGYEK